MSYFLIGRRLTSAAVGVHRVTLRAGIQASDFDFTAYVLWDKFAGLTDHDRASPIPRRPSVPRFHEPPMPLNAVSTPGCGGGPWKRGF